MGRRRKRVRRDVYSSNIQRLSVYPSPSTGSSPRKTPPPGPGEVLEVRIVSTDDYGRGIAFYKGYKVVVEDVEPGINVKVRVIRVSEDEVYAVPHPG